VLIASTLYKYGFIDAFGTGFDRTFTLCADAGVEYKYREDEFGFTFIFERNPYFLNDKINDKINAKTGRLDTQIVDAIKDNKYVTISELSSMTDKSEATIYRHLDALSKSGKVKRVGSRKAGYWRLIN